MHLLWLRSKNILQLMGFFDSDRAQGVRKLGELYSFNMYNCWNHPTSCGTAVDIKRQPLGK